MEEKLQEELGAVRHQHRVKSALVREGAKNLEAEVAALKK
jgi:hypothetical protein